MAQPAPRPYPALDAHTSKPDPEAPPTPARSAFGYLATVDADEDRINGLHHRLVTHAQRAGLTLVEVYVDRNTGPDEDDRPGLALLLDEIASHPDGVLIIPDLAHLPATPAAWEVFDQRFTEAVIEILVLDERATGALRLVPVPGIATGQTLEQLAGAGRARLTADGTFEVTVRPEDTVACLTAALARLPAGARFAESFGETTLVFCPQAAPSPAGVPAARADAGDLIPLAVVTPTGPLGQELAGFTPGDLNDELHVALAGLGLGTDDEHVLSWLSAQPAEKALTLTSLIRRARADGPPGLRTP
ncbi:hypothetical protein [Pseudofrankia sp. BMG5.36]|uniref:hypothetical protein n=1 Tax=Pseudofrankia sp. BMG5.36 TaxID=1834512 RepID=UPI0008DB19DE|nr:hypothetical protein [Pseudofrankia sp. BMG5.36]OHV63470.1 hypothetical protein BCD48_38280 [Pseudofrankia sp. BMG5.36]